MTVRELIKNLIEAYPMEAPVDVEISQGDGLVAIRPLERQIEMVDGRVRLWTALPPDDRSPGQAPQEETP